MLLHEYHFRIGLWSGNTVIPMVINAFRDVGIAFWRIWIRETGKEAATVFLERFTAYIEAGDSDGAMKLYRDHAELFLAEYKA